ncbi:DAK2 domain-containing protein [Patulibacter defluvii]|uniref:DAK2 domain-containing protein n=1 Tax=Patulibacter defluvii TaxID=3095358 RepID=UPI002A752206|nr:DAK2 domain-containing protein [Patulibacter sp. DM4]
MPAADPSIVRFRHIVAGALAHLESRRQEINDLNVFPVADGDTGDNMALTMRSVLDELDLIVADDCSLDELGREELVRRLARAALLGARGNSGVILSQLIRGAAEELVARPGELIRPPLIAAALAGAARRGYDSVRQPVEGTVLTVVREMAGAASHAVALLEPGQLGALASEEEQSAALAAVIAAAVGAGQQALDEGPELLPVLKEAGVVDAGGFGLLVLFAGVIRVLLEDRPGGDFDIRHYDAAQLSDDAAHASETYRYCTNFAVTGPALDARRARRELAELGDSIIVVVGDEQTLKIHVHTDEPDRAMALFEGEISRVDVADMDAQVAARVERGLAARSASAPDGAPDDPGEVASGAISGTASGRTALIAVVAGAGIAEAFRSLGAVVLDGGATMNPSTADLLAAVEAAGTDEAVLLTNNSNVRMAADRAAELAERPVVVVPTRSQQAGLAIAVGHDPARAAGENAAALGELLDELATGGVAPSAREDPQGRFAVGDALGYVDEQLVAWGAPEPTLRAVLDRLAEDRELLTVLSADDAPLDEAAVEALAPDGVELEQRPGGQPAWWWLVAAE